MGVGEGKGEGAVEANAHSRGGRVIAWPGGGWPATNEGVVFHDKVRGKAGAGSTVLQFYTQRYPHSADSERWAHRIASGQIVVDGKTTTDPKLELKAGSKLEYHREPWQEGQAPHSVRVLFEDEHLVALYKPSGLQVLQAAMFQQRTVLTLLHMDAESRGEPVAAPMHRLGRGTSGVLLCAKSLRAKQHLAKAFAHDAKSEGGSDIMTSPTLERPIQKIYLALVMGKVLEEPLEINVPIGCVEYNGIRGGLHCACETGKTARSVARGIHYNHSADTSIVEVDLYTGRPHQIRIHMAWAGHPLVGDPLYGHGGVPRPAESHVTETTAGTSGPNGQLPAIAAELARSEAALPGDCGYLLHALRTTFQHPVTGVLMVVEAQPPPPELDAENQQLLAHTSHIPNKKKCI